MKVIQYSRLDRWLVKKQPEQEAQISLDSYAYEYEPLSSESRLDRLRARYFKHLKEEEERIALRQKQ